MLRAYLVAVSLAAVAAGCHSATTSPDQGTQGGDVDMAMSPGGTNDMSSGDDLAGSSGSDMAKHTPVLGFAAATTLMTTYAMSPGIFTGDFNMDGKKDLFVNDWSPIVNSGGGVADALTGNGDGSFAYDATHNMQTSTGYFTVFDVNNDGKTDGVYYYVRTNPITHVTTPFLLYATSNGDGTFTQGSFSFTGAIDGLFAGDLNGDHAVDLLTYTLDTMGAKNGFALLLNNGSNSLTRTTFASPTYPIPATDLIVQDLTGDGKPDVFYAAQKQAVIVAGDGTGALAATPTILDTGVANNLSVAVGDLNADNRPDLIVGQDNNSFTVFLATAGGGFATANTYAGQGNATSVATGDFDGDGLADVVTCDGNNLTFVLNLGNGFKPPVQITQTCNKLAIGNFNADNLADVAVATAAGAFVILNTTH